MHRIVIATDGSDGSWAAVEDGVERAAEVGAEVTFVTVRPRVAVCSAMPSTNTPRPRRRIAPAFAPRLAGPAA